jgi:hypothetical protein
VVFRRVRGADIQTFVKSALRRIFGPKKKVTDTCRKLHNEELYNLFPPPDIIGTIKIKGMPLPLPLQANRVPLSLRLKNAEGGDNRFPRNVVPQNRMNITAESPYNLKSIGNSRLTNYVFPIVLKLEDSGSNFIPETGLHLTRTNWDSALKPGEMLLSISGYFSIPR